MEKTTSGGPDPGAMTKKMRISIRKTRASGEIAARSAETIVTTPTWWQPVILTDVTIGTTTDAMTGGTTDMTRGRMINVEDPAAAAATGYPE